MAVGTKIWGGQVLAVSCALVSGLHDLIKWRLCSIERAKLWGILTRLRVAWGENYHRVELESNSMSSVNITTKGVNARHLWRDLIHAIHQMIQLDWEYNIKYIPKEIIRYLTKIVLVYMQIFFYFNFQLERLLNCSYHMLLVFFLKIC